MEILGRKIADKGFFINLESSKDRLYNIEKQIIEYKINNLVRFEAQTDELIQSSATKSHKGVFETAKKENLEVIFVSEDDFQINNECTYFLNHKKQFELLLDEFVSEIEVNDWDVILLGCNPKTRIVPKTNMLGFVYKSTGAWAYIIKKRAYEYILENFEYKKDYLAIDDILPMLNFMGFKTLTSIPMLITHAVGYESTLQPRGPVDYSQWIQGSYDLNLYSKYTNISEKGIEVRLNNFESNVTLVIVGHFVPDFMKYLRYLIKSLPEELLKCKIHVHYDCDPTDFDNKNKLSQYFRDIKYELNVNLTYSFGGLISSIDYLIDKINTEFFILLEHDWVFLSKNSIDFESLVGVMKKYSFINAVWFNKDDNQLRGFEIESDVNNVVTPYELEKRVSEINLITTCRWSNNPVIFKTNKFKEWYYNIIKNEYVGKLQQGSNNVEETMIRVYREEIKQNKWNDVMDKWGTYLYGNIGDGPFVGHTDASKRYQTINRTTAEDNGDDFINKNKLTNID
jgi:hypothetical protein